MRASPASISALDVWDILVATVLAPGSMGLRLQALLEMKYADQGQLVDDLEGVDALTGTCTTPENLINGSTADAAVFNNVNEYVEIDFQRPVMIKELRHYGATGSHGDNRYRLQALVDSVLTDALIDIVDRDLASWSDWLPLTAPLTAQIWRFEITTKAATGYIAQAEFRGVIQA